MRARRASAMGILMAFGILCVPAPAAAQRAFSLGTWSALFDFGFDHDGQLTSLRDDPINTLQRNLFRQKLRVRNTGFVLGRRWATFTPNLTLGLSQHKLATGGESGLLLSEVLAYDLTVMVLPDKPYNLRLFTTKSDTSTPLRFGGSTEVDVSTRGATLSFAGSVLRSSFAYWERRLQVQSTGIGSNDRHELRKSLSYRDTGAWGRSDLSVRLEKEDVDDKMFPDSRFSSRITDLYHRYRLFSNTAETLTSSFRQYSRSGRQREEVVRLEERLEWQLAESLSGRFSYRYRGRETDDRETVEHRTIVDVSHQLYDSLQTSALLQFGWQDRNDGEHRGVGARLAARYNKNLPWDARVTANWSFRVDQQADRSETGDQQFIDERHVARLGLPFQLQVPEVIEASVVITDVDARTIFVRGVDYDIRTVGSFTEITPTVDGAIDEAEVLHVDYLVLAPREVRFDVRQQSLGVGFQRGVLAATYSYSTSTSTTLDGDDEGLLEADTAVHLGSVTINWSNERTTVVASHRYRRQVQSRLDYTSLGFSQVLRFNLNSHYVLGVSANEEFSDFIVPERRTQRLSGRSTLQWAALPGLRVSALAALRLWSDTLSVNETFSEVGARAEWSFPSFDVRASLTRQYRWRGDTSYQGVRYTLQASRAF